jgi:SPP1 gp7 family putative phage head morphogenesis protein
MSAITTFDAPGGISSQPTINPLSISVHDVIKWIADRANRVIEIDRWDEIGAEEYGRSFTAARTTGSNVVADLYREFMATVAGDQSSPESYAERVVPILQEKGWLGGDARELGARAELIYNTNIRTAQAVSKWREIQRAKSVMPYLRIVGVQDNRERDSHRMLDNITLRVDDPFWLRCFPPFGFRCRHSTIQYTRGQFERRKMKLTDPDEAMERFERAKRMDKGFWAINPGIASDLIQVQSVASANANAMDGAPPMDPREIARSGQAAWGRVFGEVAARLIKRLGEGE